MNQREKNMLILLGVIAAIAINFMLYSSYKAKMIKLEEEKIKVKGEWETRDAILTDGTTWEETREWFEKNNPKAITIEDAQDQLLKEVKAAAERCKLIINPSKPINFLPAILDGVYPRARVTLNFTSSDDALFQWVTQLNDSKMFRVVTALKVEPNADKSNVMVEAIVEQWVSPQDIVAPETQGEAPAIEGTQKNKPATVATPAPAPNTQPAPPVSEK